MSASQKGHKGFIQLSSKKTMVTDLKTNCSSYYVSINAAAKALSCSDVSILKNLKSKNKNHIKLDMFLHYYSFSKNLRYYNKMKLSN